MKFKLELDSLSVESFALGGTGDGIGTVRAHGDGETISGCITGVLLNCPYTPNCVAVQYPSNPGSAHPYSAMPQNCATPTGLFDFDHATCGDCVPTRANCEPHTHGYGCR